MRYQHDAIIELQQRPHKVRHLGQIVRIAAGKALVQEELARFGSSRAGHAEGDANRETGDETLKARCLFDGGNGCNVCNGSNACA